VSRPGAEIATSHAPFEDASVEAVFGAHPCRIRARLMALRQLIFDTAAATEGVGRLDETLKWGQPSYLTPETRSGSTIRIDRAGPGDHRIALYVHCQTDLVSTFRELYPDAFVYQGSRAVLIEDVHNTAAISLRHCIALALTYHLRKRAGRKARRSP
jgi:hypothetical protein